jgi:hypothetical protein
VLGFEPLRVVIEMKTVYVNDVPIGEASNWMEAEELLDNAGISFIGKPGAAEGPTGFFIYGTRTVSVQQRRSRTGENIA